VRKIISIIPARGGSTAVPQKNIKKIAGIPLISHSIRQSLASELIEQTYVTTDSREIGNVAQEEGAIFIERPTELATDIASSESALIDAINQIRKTENYTPDLVVFLQCTSPVRRADDIDNAIKLLKHQKADSLLSVVENHRFIWEESRGSATSINYDYKNRARRQDFQPQYAENGSIYIFRTDDLIKYNNRLSGNIALYKMDAITAYEIDTTLDFSIVEMIMNSLKQPG
jgi:N-acylneuraminate cytidylyltransferase